jgi:hypothetical protein
MVLLPAASWTVTSIVSNWSQLQVLRAVEVYKAIRARPG